MAGNDERATIVIKKVKKGGGGHHGGAWKVAYADFVTAMMAFFLLLWLLNATTEEQKRGIADYFSPASISKSNSGAGGVMGGQTISPDGAQISDTSPVGVTISLPGAEEEWEGESKSEVAAEGGKKDINEELDEQEMQRMMAELEAERFEAAKEELLDTIRTDSELKDLEDNLVIDMTPEGMRIQIVDKEGTSMFPSGSADMFEHTQRLHNLVVEAIRDLANRIAIKGHTDATPFNRQDGYTNWELSTDRANASRRALISNGLPSARVASVVGRAAEDPFVKEDPFAPQNRRISIILLRDNPIEENPEFQSGNENQPSKPASP